MSRASPADIMVAGGARALAPPFRPRAWGEDMAAEDTQAAPEGAGLYVDLENLHADAQVTGQEAD